MIVSTDLRARLLVLLATAYPLVLGIDLFGIAGGPPPYRIVPDIHRPKNALHYSSRTPTRRRSRIIESANHSFEGSSSRRQRLATPRPLYSEHPARLVQTRGMDQVERAGCCLTFGNGVKRLAALT